MSTEAWERFAWASIAVGVIGISLIGWAIYELIDFFMVNK